MASVRFALGHVPSSCHPGRPLADTAQQAPNQPRPYPGSYLPNGGGGAPSGPAPGAVPLLPNQGRVIQQGSARVLCIADVRGRLPQRLACSAESLTRGQVTYSLSTSWPPTHGQTTSSTRATSASTMTAPSTALPTSTPTHLHPPALSEDAAVMLTATGPSSTLRSTRRYSPTASSAPSLRHPPSRPSRNALRANTCRCQSCPSSSTRRTRSTSPCTQCGAPAKTCRYWRSCGPESTRWTICT